LARAAVALYGVGSVKSSTTGRIVAVDGGMGDNPRPALYGARYTALSATRPLAPVVGLADVVGRYCESGDVLAREVPLPGVDEGDLICIPVAGAYQLAMASAYNLVAPPAAVLIDADGVTLVSRRATVEDLLARDL
jgi:diaminopimelate decarboxylase